MKTLWVRWLLEGVAVIIGAALMYRLAFPTNVGLSTATFANPALDALPADAGVAPSLSPQASQPAAAIVPPQLILRGNGEGASMPIRLQPGLVVFNIQHSSPTPFAVFLLNEADEHLALLANASTPISGTQAFGIRTAGTYYLHVIGTDTWSVAVDAVAPATPQPFTALSGTGMRVSPPFEFAGGSYTFGWSHTGTLGWTAVLWSLDGTQRLEIAAANGATSGTATLVVPEDGSYVVMVMADAAWSLEETDGLK